MRTLAALSALLMLAGCDSKTPAGPATSGPAASAGPAAAAEPARAEATYHFGTSDTHTLISFLSKTGIMKILGQTTKVRGSATVDFAAGTGKCEVIVPAFTLDSGYPDRDRAMMGKTYLDKNQFPTIEFRSTKAVKGAGNSWTLDGKFTLHGVTKDIQIPATVIPVPAATAQVADLGDGTWIRVLTNFKIALADYGIVIPPTAVATVEPVISLEIDLYGSTTPPATETPIVEGKGPEKPPQRAVRAKPVSEEGIAGTKYQFGKKPQFTHIAVTSQTSLEKIVATTSTLSGVVGIDDAKGSAQFRFRIPAATLQTRVESRDKQFHGPEGLDVKAHEEILFESTKAAKKDANTWTVEGNLTLHGVARSKTIEVAMKHIPGEEMKKANWGDKPGVSFTTHFKVNLSEHGIKVPEKSIARVNDEWSVSIELIALPAEPKE